MEKNKRFRYGGRKGGNKEEIDWKWVTEEGSEECHASVGSERGASKVLLVRDPTRHFLGGSERGFRFKREEIWEGGSCFVGEVNQLAAWALHWWIGWEWTVFPCHSVTAQRIIPDLRREARGTKRTGTRRPWWWRLKRGTATPTCLPVKCSLVCG